MAQKYHINKHGVPAPCKAKKGNCPLGGETQHFDTPEEAQEYADELNERKYGLIGKAQARVRFEDRKIGEKYDIVTWEEDNGYQGTDHMTLVEEMKVDGETIQIFEDDDKYRMATYNHEGDIDWDVMRNINEQDLSSGGNTLNYLEKLKNEPAGEYKEYSGKPDVEASDEFFADPTNVELTSEKKEERLDENFTFGGVTDVKNEGEFFTDPTNVELTSEKKEERLDENFTFGNVTDGKNEGEFDNTLL